MQRALPRSNHSGYSLWTVDSRSRLLWQVVCRWQCETDRQLQQFCKRTWAWWYLGPLKIIAIKPLYWKCLGSIGLTTDHDLHRRRRKPLEPFFSRLGVNRVEPMVVETVSKLVDRFKNLKGTGTVIHLEHAFSAFSGDVIGNLCCEEHVNFLDDEDFSPERCVHSCHAVLWLYMLMILKLQYDTPLFFYCLLFCLDFHGLFRTLNLPDVLDNVDHIIAS